MRADVELKLVHDGDNWVVSNDAFSASGRTFEDLDLKIKHHLEHCGEFAPGSTVKVFMGYDFDTIPTWLRQYHTHYFNRILQIDLDH
jgi:hypothetical protein